MTPKFGTWSTTFWGLGIALMSYDGEMHWGVNADYDLVPDLHAFMDDLESAYQELRELAEKASGQGTV